MAEVEAEVEVEEADEAIKGEEVGEHKKHHKKMLLSLRIKKIPSLRKAKEESNNKLSRKKEVIKIVREATNGEGGSEAVTMAQIEAMLKCSSVPEIQSEKLMRLNRSLHYRQHSKR